MGALPRVRVAAVIKRDDALLLVRHQKDGETYWLLPGGGVDYGEPLDQALIREVREETGLEIRVGRILFINDSIPPDKHRHSVQVTFAAAIGGGEICLGDDPRLAECRFVAAVQLPDLVLYPNMKQVLAALDDGTPPAAQYLGNLWQ